MQIRSSSGGGAVVGVEPVARENGQLAVGGEGGQALLEGHEVGVHGRAGGLGQIVGVGRVGGERVQGVDVVQRSEVVEPQDVAVQELRALDEVADDARVVRNGDAVGLLSGDGGGMRVGNRADAADALHDLRSVLGRAVLHDKLHAAEAAAGHPCIRHDAVLNLHLDAQMTLDAGDRVDD